MSRIKNNIEIVPEQKVGRHTSAEAHRELENESQAIEVFKRACDRLLNVNKWRDYAGIGASFELMDPSGKPLDRNAKIGDFVRIDIPGPGTKSGKGYDWVEIEAFYSTEEPERNSNLFSIRFRPVASPMENSGDESHFYTDEATSTYLIQRKGNLVTAAEKGRNEVPNDKTDSALDNIRNKVVGSVASFGLSEPQWKILMEGLLED